MVVDMQSLRRVPSVNHETSAGIHRDSIDSVDCGAPAGLEDTILKLSDTLRHLQRCDQNDQVKAVYGLLAKAQGELIKVSSRDASNTPLQCSQENSHTGDRDNSGMEISSVEEDLALLQSIPTANLLNTCFEVHTKKQTKDSLDRCSTVSTMSSLGGGGCTPLGTSSSTSFSPRTSWSASQRDTLPCTRPSDVDNMHLLASPFRYSSASERPSLPCFTPRVYRQPSGVIRRQSSSLIAQSIDTGKTESSQSRSHAALFQVEGIEADADDWELEFLRKSRLG